MRLRRFRKLRRNRNYATMVLVAFVGILSVMGIGYSYLQQRLSMDISLSKKEDVVPEYLAYVIASKNVNGNAEGLYEDDFGNIRYRGSNDDVKNYVTFNGEMWRIIGIFNGGHIKLIKEESIGNYAWGSNNNWTTSDLQSYLNGTFYNSFSDDAKSQATSFTYYLYAPANGRNVSMQNAYQQERNQQVGQSALYGGHATVRQNVGLMYPSDYGYAASPSCNRYLGDLNTSEFCNATGNWLFTTTMEWLQTPHMQNTAFSISTGGNVVDGVDSNAYTTKLKAVRPVIYLNMNVVWDGGIGTKSRPYKIYGALGPLTTDPINNPMNPHPTSTATTTGTGTGTGGTTAPTTGTGTGTPTTGTPTTGTPTTTGPTTGTPPGTTTPTGTVTPTTTTPIMTTSNSPVTTPNY